MSGAHLSQFSVHPASNVTVEIYHDNFNVFAFLCAVVLRFDDVCSFHPPVFMQHALNQ